MSSATRNLTRTQLAPSGGGNGGLGGTSALSWYLPSAGDPSLNAPPGLGLSAPNRSLQMNIVGPLQGVWTLLGSLDGKNYTDLAMALPAVPAATQKAGASDGAVSLITLATPAALGITTAAVSGTVGKATFTVPAGGLGGAQVGDDMVISTGADAGSYPILGISVVGTTTYAGSTRFRIPFTALATSQFVAGETITGGTSAATATVVSFALNSGSSTAGNLIVSNVAGGPFTAGETITGSTSSSTATLTLVTGAPGQSGAVVPTTVQTATVTFTTGGALTGTTGVSGAIKSGHQATFTSASGNFVVNGVVAGDGVVISGTNAGTYLVASRTSATVLVINTPAGVLTAASGETYTVQSSGVNPLAQFIEQRASAIPFLKLTFTASSLYGIVTVWASAN